jgi:hypothetical protein
VLSSTTTRPTVSAAAPISEPGRPMIIAIHASNVTSGVN